MQRRADPARVQAGPALLARVQALAREAGQAIMEIYASDFAVQHKADASPLTLADERAEAIITAGLLQLTPGLVVVAEEACAAGARPEPGRQFWLVDPLDGTREFVQRNGEFTVNIALVEDGAPVLGVVHAPALQRLYAAYLGRRASAAWCEDGPAASALRTPLACRPWPAQGATVAVSRAHGDGPALQAWLAALQQGGRLAGTLAAGSALKFGLLAAGLADLYPRFGRTMEWDTAAGHAVLRAAGGDVRDLQGQPLRYGKPGFDNPHFIASATPGPA